MAVENGPGSVLVAGDRAALGEFIARCAADGARTKRFPTDFASHSPLVEPVRDELLAALAPIRPRTGTVPFFSTVTGDRVDTARLDAAYWYGNLRGRVEFARTARALADQGHGIFVEIGPHPVLTSSLQENLGDGALVTGTLRRDEGGIRRFLRSWSDLLVRGGQVDRSRPFQGTGARRVELPSYAFQRERYWYAAGSGSSDAAGLGLGGVDHPLLGAAVTVAGTGQTLLTGRLSAHRHPWAAGYMVGGAAVLPSSVLVELALRAGDEVGCTSVDELSVLAPLVVPVSGGVQLQVTVDGPDSDGVRALAVHARPEEGEEPWTEIARARLAVRGRGEAFSLEPWPPDGARSVDLAEAGADADVGRDVADADADDCEGVGSAGGERERGTTATAMAEAMAASAAPEPEPGSARGASASQRAPHFPSVTALWRENPDDERENPGDGRENPGDGRDRPAVKGDRPGVNGVPSFCAVVALPEKAVGEAMRLRPAPGAARRGRPSRAAHRDRSGRALPYRCRLGRGAAVRHRGDGAAGTAVAFRRRNLVRPARRPGGAAGRRDRLAHPGPGRRGGHEAVGCVAVGLPAPGLPLPRALDPDRPHAAAGALACPRGGPRERGSVPGRGHRRGLRPAHLPGGDRPGGRRPWGRPADARRDPCLAGGGPVHRYPADGADPGRGGDRSR